MGGEVRGAFETLLRTLSLAPVVVQATAMGLGENQITTFLLPVRSSSHPLFNPDLDYSVYLSNPYFFVFFQTFLAETEFVPIDLPERFLVYKRTSYFTDEPIGI